MGAQSFRKANKAYEDWLRAQLHGDLVKRDLAAKWAKMKKGAFPFLRATYWRWAETILDICPELENAPKLLAVGDIHLENFGTWRDDDGRLVWGVNDFDEAAVMPYPLDLVRLATSAALARPTADIGMRHICTAVLVGFRKGLNNPRPFALDEEHTWLRKLTVVPSQDRADFWRKVDELKPAGNIPALYRQAIEAAMPGPDAEIEKFSARTAGTGSLGRPRFVGVATWRGGRVVREAKALVPSGWTRLPGRGTPKLRCAEIALGRFRSPDPWWNATHRVVVRRLSPNSRKIEVKRNPDELLDPRMLSAMGHEIANVQLGTGVNRKTIEGDLNRRPDHWLHHATKAAAKFVAAEFLEWRKGG